MDSSSSDRDPVELLAEEFMERRRRGESPSIQEYEEKYPTHAEDIRDVFPALIVMDEADPGATDLNLQQSNLQDAWSQPPLQRIGDYQILREIGRGGMGVVYEAEQLSLRRRVALKILPQSISRDSRSMARFQREAQAAARLHHTNIVPVYEVGQDQDTSFYAMQLIQGRGLDEVIQDLCHLQDETN